MCRLRAVGPYIGSSRLRAEVVYFRDLAEFGATIGAAAEQLGISGTAIEKDYWVTPGTSGIAARLRQ